MLTETESEAVPSLDTLLSRAMKDQIQVVDEQLENKLQKSGRRKHYKCKHCTFIATEKVIY